FRDFELVELQHAPENIGRLRGDVIELDALGLDRPVAQGQRAVVGAAGKCQTQLAHRFTPGRASSELSRADLARMKSARAARSIFPSPREALSYAHISIASKE